jgi:hypothetical protein
MNEKIKELAEQATEVSEWLSGNLCPDAPDLAKFAELIVRQCIKSTLSLRDTAIDNEWNLDETFHMIVDTIVEDLDMQHIFRVEE